MKFFVLSSCLLCIAFLSGSISAQTEDCRHLSGLPIPIGAPVICGEVKLRGLVDREVRPAIHVSLIVGGVQADRMRTNESGYYYFLKSPSNNSSIVFEVNNTEVGRVLLSSGVGSSVRRDIEVDMNLFRQAAEQTAPGVISARSAYKRSADADRAFSLAMGAVKAKKTDEAIAAFKNIVERDSTDFVAWTELGTLYFSASKLDDSESAYNNAVELKPDFMPALMNLGKLHMSQKKFEKSAQVFYKAVNADPQSADAFHYLGESFLQTKEGTKAVVALNEAIRLAPVEKADIHLRLATLYDKAKLKDKAAAEYKAFVSKVPNYKDREKLAQYIKENSK